MAMLGAYGGNDPKSILAFEGWLGRKVDGILGVVGGANWQDFTSSVGWMVNSVWSQIPREVFWSVPLIISDGTATLAQAATGAYDAHYKSVARTILGSRSGDTRPIYIRTGWEHNADWFPWSAIGKEAQFAGAFRAFVTAFRSVSNRFRFEWNVNEAWGGVNPANTYPGDSFVDIIGMDFYYTIQYAPANDPLGAWNSMLTRTYGLNWLENFAKAHNKPTAYSEWGIQSDSASPYLEKAKAWFDSHNVVYHCYWNSDAAYKGMLSDNRFPNAGATFKRLFNTATPAPAPAPAPTPTPTSDPRDAEIAALKARIEKIKAAVAAG